MGELNARIPVTVETRDELRSMKVGTERYEDVLRRLIDDNGGED
jgi:predicted CopG family antitoxin